MDIEDARKLLTDAGLFFEPFEGEPDGEKWAKCLNLNDAFYWGCADAQLVEDEELPRLATLFFRYGWCGVAYWVCVEKRGGEVPEFKDQRRFIEFVKQEEQLRNSEPSSSKRAYADLQYTVGAAT